MGKKITIAIDGSSSTGKSTVAKRLAAELGYVYVDSGAMYRAVTLYALQNGLIGPDFFDTKELGSQLPNLKISFQKTNPHHTYLNGRDVETEIRTMEVSRHVSRVAELSAVRKVLVGMQQEMGKEKGVVMDGRDIGTVVFPEAELKIFLTASLSKRAARRYGEHLDRGDDVTLETVTANLEERDRIDSSREDSPLLRADDAVEIDNSLIDKEATFRKILALARERIGS